MKNSDKVHRPLLEALTAEMIPLRIQATIATSMVSPLPFPRPFEVRARFPSDQRTASISGNDQSLVDTSRSGLRRRDRNGLVRSHELSVNPHGVMIGVTTSRPA